MLALAAMAVVRLGGAGAPAAGGTGRRRVPFADVLRDPELARLNVGIFALHAILMALFVVVPLSLVRAGLPAGSHWSVYLGAVGAGLPPHAPVRGGRGRSPATSGPSSSARSPCWPRASRVLAAARPTGSGRSRAGLVIFFAAFNVLEAKLPALVSKAAPPAAKGAASGVYSSVQFLGTFVGGAAGGAIAQHFGPVAVLAACLALAAVWLAVGLADGRAGRPRMRTARAPRAASHPTPDPGRKPWHPSTKSSSSAISAAIPRRATCPTAAPSPTCRSRPPRSWKDKNGEKQEKTEWHRVAFFGKLAEIAGEYLKKGSQVYVEGRLQTRKWQDKDGQDKYTTEIVADRMQMLGSRQGMGGGDREREPGGEREGAARPAGKPAAAKPAGSKFDDFEDDIPF